MKYVVCYSGGHNSAIAAIETVRRFGREKVILLNHDISSKVESIKIKEFKKRIAENLKVQISYSNCKNFKNQTPLSLCVEHGAIKFRAGREICTYYLKTRPFYDWLEENYPVEKGTISEEITLIYGFDSTEVRRIQRRRSFLLGIGYRSMYPLAEWERTIHEIEEIGISRPEVYKASKHANCDGCLKAGKQHWYKVYCCRPDIYEEAKEVEGKLDYSIIKNTFLRDLEPEFERMRLTGIPATENMDSYWFWNYAKK